MHKTTELSVPAQAARIFHLLLLLYPERYRKHYGSDMSLVFRDMYMEELTKKGTVGVNFWFFQFTDMTKSIIHEHIAEIGKKGIQKYLQQTFHINRYNIIGGIFLLPSLLVLCIDLISRIIQGDLTHYNRPVYALLSHTPLYWYPVLFTWIIVFPFLAIALNLIPLAHNIYKKHEQVINIRFYKQHILSVLIVTFAIFFLLLIKLHDFAPCMIHGLFRVGFGQFTHIIAVCRNA